jgi:hypothetical protein
MPEKTKSVAVVGPINSTKKMLGPGQTLESLAKAIGPTHVIGPIDIKSIVGPMNDTSGIELSASSLKRVNVRLLSDNKFVYLQCKVCSTIWMPVLQEGKCLPPDWWSCPKDEKHSQKS